MSYRCRLNGGPADLVKVDRAELEEEIRVAADDEPGGEALYRLKRDQWDEPMEFGGVYEYGYRNRVDYTLSDAQLRELEARRESQARQARRPPTF